MDYYRFVQYGKLKYPDGIIPELVEVAGHLDKEEIEDYPKYSLHTEYSYGKRELSSDLLGKYQELRDTNKEGVPQLWKNKEWSSQFEEFVLDLTQGHTAPVVVEIHPPFSDYSNLDQFIERYKVFEERLHENYPDTEIVVENRAGTVYKGGSFIISKATQIQSLCEMIEKTNTMLIINVLFKN